MRLIDYSTGSPLDGTVSEALTKASLASPPTGAVCAYRDEGGTWQHIGEHEASHYIAMGHNVRTVYIESL